MVLGVITFIVIANKLGGLSVASERVAAAEQAGMLKHSALTREHMSHLKFLTYVFIPLSVAMFPHLFQHWMTAKSAKTFQPTVFLHPIFIMIVWVPCVLLGVWATSALMPSGELIVPADTSPNAVLPVMVKKLANPYLAGLLTVGILAAIMSSLDSQFLCLGTMFTHDMVLHYLGEDRFNDKHRILIGRLFVMGVVVTAYLLSLAEPRSVFVLGVWCFSGFASLSPLVFAAIYWKRVTKAGAMASVLAAAVVWLLLFWDSDLGANRTYLFLGMMPVATIIAASTVALVGVSLLTRPPSSTVIDRYFPAKDRLADTAQSGHDNASVNLQPETSS
jgi:SSS family solute:Na+ symporter